MTTTYDFMGEKDFDLYRKISPKAKLKNLDRTTQREIVDFLNGAEGRAPHSIKATIAWLRTKGIETSLSVVSIFRTWYLRRAKMEAHQAAALDRVKEDKKKGKFKTLAEEKQAAQDYFNQLALDHDDVQMWALVQRVDLARGRQKLEARKVKLLEKSKAKPKEAVTETKLTTEEKEKRIHQIMGLD
jgi:hypothetical protein